MRKHKQCHMITSCPPPSLFIYLFLGSGYWPLEFCAGVALRRNRHKHGLSFVLHRPLGEATSTTTTNTAGIYIRMCVCVYQCVYMRISYIVLVSLERTKVASALSYCQRTNIHMYIYTHIDTFTYLHTRSMNNSRATRLCVPHCAELLRKGSRNVCHKGNIAMLSLTKPKIHKENF